NRVEHAGDEEGLALPDAGDHGSGGQRTDEHADADEGDDEGRHGDAGAELAGPQGEHRHDRAMSERVDQCWPVRREGDVAEAKLTRHEWISWFELSVLRHCRRL